MKGNISSLTYFKGTVILRNKVVFPEGAGGWGVVHVVEFLGRKTVPVGAEVPFAGLQFKLNLFIEDTEVETHILCNENRHVSKSPLLQHVPTTFYHPFPCCTWRYTVLEATLSPHTHWFSLHETTRKKDSESINECDEKKLAT